MEPIRPTLEILCGPIGCGKSTYAAGKSLAGWITINDDAIVSALHGGNHSYYDKTLKTFYKSIEIDILKGAMDKQRCIIIDRPNQSRLTRARYITIARLYDYQVTLTLFPWPLPEISAAARFRKNNRGKPFEHWLAAARRQAAEYQVPDKEIEKFDTLIIHPTYQL